MSDTEKGLPCNRSYEQVYGYGDYGKPFKDADKAFEKKFGYDYDSRKPTKESGKAKTKK